MTARFTLPLMLLLFHHAVLSQTLDIRTYQQVFPSRITYSLPGACQYSETIYYYPVSTVLVCGKSNDWHQQSLSEFMVANLPAASAYVGLLVKVTDGSSSNDCSTGGGSTVSLCSSTGKNWVASGGGGIPTVSGNLCAIGDSITGDSNNTDGLRGPSWFSQFAQSSQSFKFVHNGAVSGYTTAQILANISTNLFAYPSCGTVMFTGGTNDVFSGIPIATTEANITSIISQVKAHGMSIVVGTIPPQDTTAPPTYTPINVPMITALNQWIQRYCASIAVPVVDFYSVLATTTGAYQTGVTSDGIHPNPVGWNQMALLASSSLASLFKSTPTPYLYPLNTADTNNQIDCPLFLCTGTSFPPTGYTVASSSGNVTWSLVSGAAGFTGNVIQNTKATSSSGDSDYVQSYFAVTASTGDLMALRARVNLIGSISTMTSCQLSISVLTSGFGTVISYTPVSVWTAPFAGWINFEFPWPATGYYLIIYIQTYAGTGTYQVGQLGLYDLTTQIGATH